MKRKLLLVSAFAAAIGLVIIPVMISDVALAQSSNKMGVRNGCYTTNGKKIPCDKMHAEDKKKK
jgi:hypothetical protein